MAWQVLRAALIRSCPDLIILWSLKYYPVKNQKKKGKTPLKLPNDSNTKTLNTHARAHTRARTRARIHIQAHAHTLRVCYSHHCRQSLTRATRLPLPLPGYRAWVCGGGREARRLRITGRSRGAAQGGAHGFWALCALPEGQPGPLARILCSPFLTGLGASSLTHSLIPNLLNSVIPHHLQDSPRLLRDCGEAGDKWRGEPWFISVRLLLWSFYTGTLPAVVYFLFLISSLVSSFPTFLLFF